MYDKSKKTWSQRLKITKTEKSSFSSTASVTTSSSSVAANIGGVVSKQQHQQKYYQQTAAQHNHHQHPQYHHFTVGKSSHYPSAMHLPSALQFSDYQSVGVGYATDYMSPATSSSRSMKYADPWIYSTVRGIPARPYHHLFQQQTVATPNYPTHPHAAAIFATPTQLSQHTEALAVVICSCPEYLNGTKRDLKKASVCKKCKGSRLPLTTIGSVVPATKLRANAKAAIAGSPAVAAAAAAATMRIISMTKKSRPTILDPQKDPYDLMRRTRLLSPDPPGSCSSGGAGNNLSLGGSKDNQRGRGKSISPPRGRTRTRHKLPPAPPPLLSSSNIKSSSVKKNKSAISSEVNIMTSSGKDNMQDCWLAEEDDEILLRGGGGGGIDDSSMTLTSTLASTSISTTANGTVSAKAVQSRRSILRCNVNPYDLISIESNQETTSLVNVSKNKSKNKQTSTSLSLHNITTSSSTSSSSSTSTSSQSTATTAAAAGASPSSSSLATNKSRISAVSQNEFMPPNDDDFNVEDAALNEDDPPPFITSNQKNHNSAAPSKKRQQQQLHRESHSTANRLMNAAVVGGAKTNKNKNQNHQNTVSARRTPAPKRPTTSANSNNIQQQGRATATATVTATKQKTFASNNANSSFETGSNNNRKTSTNKIGSAANDTKKSNYCNVQAIAGQRIILGKQSSSKKSLIKQSGDGNAYESIIINSSSEEEEEEEEDVNANMNVNVDVMMMTMTAKLNQTNDEQQDGSSTMTMKVDRDSENINNNHHQSLPKRPPRYKKLDMADAIADADVAAAAAEPKHSTTMMSNAVVNDEVSTMAAEVTVLSVAPVQNIKSILKRPLSKPSNNKSDDLSIDTDGVTARTSIDNRESPLALTSSSTAMATDLGNGVGGGGAVAGFGGMKPALSSSINQTSAASQTISTSQFYIPLPQSRKKVQFMMEDNIIYHKVDDSPRNNAKNHNLSRIKAGNNDDGNAEQSATGSSKFLGSNYEYYSKKHQNHHQKQQQQAQQELSTVSYKVTHEKLANNIQQYNGSQRNSNENDREESNGNNDTSTSASAALQASVLREIQQESDLVSRGLNGKDTKVCNIDGDGNGNKTAINDSTMSYDIDHDEKSGLGIVDMNGDFDDVVVLVGGACIANSTVNANVDFTDENYEDVITSEAATQQQTKQGGRKEKVTADSNSKQVHLIMSQQNLRLKDIRAASTTTKRFPSTTTSSSDGNLSPLQLSSSPERAVPSQSQSLSLSPSPSPSTFTFTSASASPTAAITTTMPSTESIRSTTSSVMLMASTVLSPLQFKVENDSRNAAGATTGDRCNNEISFYEIQPEDSDYDDIACKKLQALVESDNTVRVTQSRNPIRRSHSERMPPVYNKLTSASCGIENTNNIAGGSTKDQHNGSHEKQHHSTNSNGSNGSGSINGGNGNGSNVSNATNNGTSIFSLNFKDTTALRMKNHNHKDSRDLFSQNNSSTPVRASFSSTIRPKVPPPPPPSSALTPLLSSPPSPLQLLNSTIASANIYTGGDSVSSVEKVGEKATTNILPVTAIEAATAAKTTTMTEQRTATATSTTRKTKTKTPDATTSKCKENFLSLSPSAQAPHSTDNDDSEKRKRKQTFAPPTISISTTAETPVVKDAVTKKDFEKSKTNEKEEVKAEAATSGRRLDSKKQQKQQQSLHQCTEALRTNVRNQRNPVDKSVISRKGNGTSSTDATNVTKIPALESTMESNAIVVDKIDRKLIFEDKPQQPLPVSPKTTICTHDSETNVNGGNSSGITTTTTTTTTRAAEKVEKNISGSPQQMVVRVAPFNKKSSEVHRLKISHTDDIESYGLTASDNQQQQQQQQSFFNSGGSTTNTNDDNDFSYTQKKTSILINGDDCYSTMNLGLDASTPIYQSSVVVADYSVSPIFREANKGQDALFTYEGLKVTTTSNMVTINLSSPRSAEEELIQQFNNVNRLRTRRQAQSDAATCSISSGRAIIPINGTTTSYEGLHRSASSTSSASTSSAVSTNSGSLNATTISASVCDAGPLTSTSKRGRTLIKLDYGEEFSSDVTSSPTLTASTCDKQEAASNSTPPSPPSEESNEHSELMSHEAELLKILRNPVEAVKRNLVPHVCGRNDGKTTDGPENARNKKMKDNGVHAPIDDSSSFKHIDTEEKETSSGGEISDSLTTQLRRKEFGRKNAERNSFIAKLLEDSTLGQVADGLETETVAELIESSLKRLKNSRNCAAAIDITGSKADNDDINRLISISLRKLQEERHASHATSSMISSSSSSGGGSTSTAAVIVPAAKDEDRQSNRGSISSANSFASANNYEMFEFDTNESDCYQSCSSEITTPGDDEIASAEIRSKFYQLVVDATLAEIELCTTVEEEEGEESIEEAEEHHYESIRHTTAAADPIYEEITDVPPPLPLTAPPINDVNDLEKKSARSIFEGASKYDILSYLVDAKERGLVREESFEYPINFSNPVIIEEDANDTLSDLGKRKLKKNIRSRFSSTLSDSSEDNQSTLSSLSPPPPATATAPALAPASFICGSTDLLSRKSASSSNEIERNDSGVGSETSKSSRSKYQSPPTSGINGALIPKNSPIHLCEDCDGPVETQVTNDGGVMFAPLVCRKCGKKRIERKEIITEIVETEEKYGRDLQIILEEFYHPMLVAGLLTQEQLSAIFLNTEELLENNQTLAEKMRDALDIAIEQGDDDLLTVNIGRIFLDFTQMLHAFESYCVRQAGASLLLANLEKDKELLRIFLKVSQMENAVLRRMNLNSFLMVPVQRVTKYPLLLARLYKVTPAHLEGRDLLKQAQEKIELHLNHINQEAKDVPTKLWRRISSSSPNRRASCEIDMINIKLRKMAIDILEWNHDEVRFVMEGKLLYTQPTDSNWKKARSIKLTPVNALLVTNGKPSANYKAEKMSDKLNFPKHTGIREASFLLVKEKCGRYTLIREPLYLDRCVVCSEADLDDYFEIQEISSKDTFIFKAEDGVRTKQWYTQLQYHAQGMGAWRKRRNALANIMINGMLART